MLKNPLMYGQQRDLSVDIGLGEDVGVTFHSSSECLNVNEYGIVTVPSEVTEVVTAFVTVLDESGQERAVVEFTVVPTDLDIENYVPIADFFSDTVISVSGATESECLEEVIEENTVSNITVSDNLDGTINLSWECSLAGYRDYVVELQVQEQEEEYVTVKTLSENCESPVGLVIDVSDVVYFQQLANSTYRFLITDITNQNSEISNSFCSELFTVSEQVGSEALNESPSPIDTLTDLAEVLIEEESGEEEAGETN